MTTLLYFAIATGALSIAIDICLILIIIWRGHYFARIEEYLRGLAEIQNTLKQMALDHHTSVQELSNANTELIIKHIGFVNRWQKAIAKLVRIGGHPPMSAIDAATELHDVGLDITKTAFEDKRNLEDDAEKF